MGLKENWKGNFTHLHGAFVVSLKVGRKLKRQNFIICNHETVYIIVVLSFYIAAFFTFIFLKKKKNNRSKTMKEQS